MEKIKIRYMMLSARPAIPQEKPVNGNREVTEVGKW